MQPQYQNQPRHQQMYEDPRNNHMQQQQQFAHPPNFKGQKRNASQVQDFPHDFEQYEVPHVRQRSPRMNHATDASPTLKRQFEQEPYSKQPHTGTQRRNGSNASAPYQPRPSTNSYYEVQGQEQDDVSDNENGWSEIKTKIDREYQKKLKQVNDEAMKKLKDHEREYQELLEKTKFLYTQKQLEQQPARSASRGSVASRPDSRVSNLSNVSFLSSNLDGGNNKNDRYRFFSPRAVEANQLDNRTDQEKRNETNQIKLFYKEYCAVVKRNVNMDNQLYIVDVLAQLHFLGDEDMRDATHENLVHVLQEHRDKLMVFSRSGEYSGESEDIVKNFFKILCGILNLKLKQRGHNQLDDTLLKQYVSAINYDHEEQDFVLMDQFHTIRSLINRKAFCLNHQQIEYIHDKFRNMFEKRQRHQYNMKRATEAHLPKQQLPVQQEPEYAHIRSNAAEQGLDQESYQYKQVKVHTPNRPKVLYQETRKSRDSLPQMQQQYQPLSATMPKKTGKRPWSGARPSSSQRGNDSIASGADQFRNYNPSAHKPQTNVPVDYWQHNPSSFQKMQQPPVHAISGTPEQRQRDPMYEHEQPQLKTSPKHQYDPRDRSPRNQPQRHYPATGTTQPPTEQQQRQFDNRPNMSATYQPKVHNQAPRRVIPSTEPICVLKIELDGEHVEEIRVYEGDKPDQIVEEFGQTFNLSDNAKRRLLMQINEQIEADNQH